MLTAFQRPVHPNCTARSVGSSTEKRADFERRRGYKKFKFSRCYCCFFISRSSLNHLAFTGVPAYLQSTFVGLAFKRYKSRNSVPIEIVDERSMRRQWDRWRYEHGDTPGAFPSFVKLPGSIASSRANALPHVEAVSSKPLRTMSFSRFPDANWQTCNSASVTEINHQ